MAALPPPALIVLRSAATLVLSAMIGQAGWAAAFLGGEPRYLPVHEFFGAVTVVIGVLSALCYLVLRRAAGVVNVSLAVGFAIGAVLQYLLGQGQQVAVHIFFGVLLVMLATALTSWTYRHRLPE